MTSSDGSGPGGRKRRAGACPPPVYLHIGEPKTGTTFMQQILWDNRAWLAARGVVLPGYSDRDHSRASRDLREAPRLASDPVDPWTGEWDVLTGQALAAKKATVISSELLVACTPHQASRAIRSLLPAEVHIILTARNIASLLTAEWQETIKCRGTLPWEQWLDGVVGSTSAADRRRRSWFWTVHDTLANLEMWSRDIPPDHVHVVTLPQQAPADALWVRFASVLGIEPAGAVLPPARVNPSLGLAEAEVLRRLNETLSDEMPDWFYTPNIKRILAHDTLRSQGGQARLALPPGEQSWAREQAEILIAGLRDSKYHIVGDLTDILPQPAAGQCVTPASLPAAQLLDAALRSAAALADQTYRVRYPSRTPQPRPHGLRQRVSRLEWTVLNGLWTRRMLRRASRLASVRRLRVAIWVVLMRPARQGPGPALAAKPELAVTPPVVTPPAMTPPAVPL